MPTFNASQLQTIAQSVLHGAGVREEDAAVVARELVEANLVGHDSHGVIRLMQYAEQIRDGVIDISAAPEVIIDKPGLILIDGHQYFGQVVASRALELAEERARRHGTFTVFARNTAHVGRVGSYTGRAVASGFAAMMAVNSPGRGRVSPFGGVEARLPTNPISFAAPGPDGPIVLDMTSSTVAEGKVRVAHQRGDAVPEGWLADGEGRPVTDPDRLYNDPTVTMLPLGGASGFKGTGLAIAIDILCGVLTGFGVARPDLHLGNNGIWLHLVDIESLTDRATYDQWLAGYVAWIKSSRKAPGFEAILMPGEIEWQRRAQREQEGVPIPDETWRQIVELGAKLGVEV